MKIPVILGYFLLIIINCLLNACDNAKAEQQSQHFISDGKAKVNSDVMSLPTSNKITKVAYAASNTRDPFIDSHIIENSNGLKVVECGKQRLISMDFQDISVRSLLQKLAQTAGLNLIISDAVTGTITLHISQLNWQQILDIILQDQGLAKRCIGNIYLVAPVNVIAQHDKQVLEAQQQIDELASLQSELVPIKYGKAVDIVTMLKGQGSSLLSERGSVSADTRTNTIWVEEIPQKINEVKHLIQQLDIPVRQVLIEARIVNVDCNYEKDLGMRFGMSGEGHVSGTLTGANQLANGVPAGDIPLNQRLNMDLPAVPLGGANPVSVGLALAHLSRGTLLDLELSALESEGGGKIISKPQLITADQQAAQISAGEEIPYQQSTSSGATNVSFKDVVLKLNVTPQITPDGNIILTLKVNQDKVGNRLVLGTPSIDTREIETQVLVANGETIVLGGIFETDNRNYVQRLPFLGSIPGIGSLFRYHQISQQRQELLIFVTPHVLSKA